MSDKLFNVLFLSTDNSVRGIFAESILRYWGKDKFRGFSAGAKTNGQVHPLAIDLLKRLDFPNDNLESKSLDTFTSNSTETTAGQPIDFVFSLCDSIADEECPVWQDQTMIIHWNITKPLLAEGDEKEQMSNLRKIFSQLENRIKVFVSLPLEKLDEISIQKQLDALDA